MLEKKEGLVLYNDRKIRMKVKVSKRGRGLKKRGTSNVRFVNGGGVNTREKNDFTIKSLVHHHHYIKTRWSSKLLSIELLFLNIDLAHSFYILKIFQSG